MRFHAVAPRGQWINDPNALFFRDGCYWLYAQHAEDGTDPGSIGWGAFESEDLTSWRWAGRVIAPDADGRSAYSGSVAMAADGAMVTALTRHDPMSGRQSQQWIGEDSATFGPAGRDCRDPFILSAEPGARAALIARPCNWNDWRSDPSSRLEIWREHGAGQWRCDGTIGPWSPAGVLWEVPQLVRFGETDVLIVSLVDRRDDAVACSVHYWFGRFSGRGFEPEPGWPAGGKPLDLGPDFYAAIVNLEQGWPAPGRALVGWASSWAYARTVTLPNGGTGGPISLPRSLSLSDCGTRLEQRSHALLAPIGNERLDLQPGESCTVGSTGGEIRIARSDARLTVTVTRDGFPRHERSIGAVAAQPLSLAIYRDGPLIEIFFEPLGLTVTTLFPGRSAGAGH